MVILHDVFLGDLAVLLIFFARSAGEPDRGKANALEKLMLMQPSNAVGNSIN